MTEITLYVYVLMKRCTRKGNGSFWEIKINAEGFAKTTKWDNEKGWKFEVKFVGDIPTELYPKDGLSLSLSGQASWRKKGGRGGQPTL